MSISFRFVLPLLLAATMVVEPVVAQAQHVAPMMGKGGAEVYQPPEHRYHRAPPPGYVVRHGSGHRNDGPAYRDLPTHREHYRGNRNYGGYYDGGGDDGAAVAAGIIGLALGAMATDASRRSYRGSSSSHVRWCLSRYRSYDPDTDTYVGRDGHRHRCR